MSETSCVAQECCDAAYVQQLRHKSELALGTMLVQLDRLLKNSTTTSHKATLLRQFSAVDAELKRRAGQNVFPQ